MGVVRIVQSDGPAHRIAGVAVIPAGHASVECDAVNQFVITIGQSLSGWFFWSDCESLSGPSVKTDAILWRNEIKGFKHWFGANDDATIRRLMQDLADKGIQKFVAELAVELQVDHHS